ncbi:hypothetical protein GLOIN_2v1875900 [Rhizophagus irregularis DAOM 181602=DAOM 197198]|nr:hypothetical protein GLOIN_2v1875900 [Rhizophagus irregularis DAOM 181602=DAOM 197198]CAG8576846.1 8811_t:CDS:2 [Rhizophagus irregularis]
MEKCPQCGKEILSPSFEAFTVLSCGHVFHRECIKKTFLLTRQNNCLISDYAATSSASSIVRRMSNQLQIPEVPEQEMDVDNEE